MKVKVGFRARARARVRVRARARARVRVRVRVRARVRIRVRVRVRALAHRVVQRAPGRVGHHEARWLLHARSVQPDHVWVAHARERAHLAAHGLGDGA